MTNDLGVWTSEDCALLLIDYQNEMFEVIRSETSRDLVDLNVRLLAKTAKAFDVPIVLSTVGVELGFNGPTLPSILSELEGIDPIDRFGTYLHERGLIDQEGLDAVRTRIQAQFQAAVDAARRQPLPTLSDLTTDVFA